MKYILFLVALMAVLPLAGWLRRNPQATPKVWVVIGVLPWVVATTGQHGLYIALISWPQWPSFVKGTEVSILDLLALAIYFSQPRTRDPLPFRFSMAFYFLVVLLSALPAQVPMAALFYPWQLTRMFLLYAVVVRACADERVVPSLLTGMAIGLCIQTGIAIWDRLGYGILQVGGGVGDKNLLGMMSHFAIFPWFALLLAGQREKFAFLTPLAGAVVTVLTVSRATLGLNVAGAALVFALSVFRKWTRRKAMVALACAVALAMLAPIAVSSLEKRFNVQISSSDYNERDAFETAAQEIVSDHPMGVGANNYVVVATVGGYNDRAGVSSRAGSQGTSVHNTYLLAAAETGYLGVIALVFLLARPLTAAFICGWSHRNDRRGDLLLGLGTSMLTAYIHAYFEWIFFVFQTQYLLAITVGLTAGVAQQLGYWRTSRGFSSREVLPLSSTARNANLQPKLFDRKSTTPY